MTTAFNQWPNERQLVRAYAGTMAQADTTVAPTFRLYGDMRITKRRALASRKEYAGTFFGKYSPVRGPAEIEGTYEQALSFEDLAILSRYAISGGGAGVTDGNATPGYTYTRAPHATRQDLDVMCVEAGWPGFPRKADMLWFPECTISGDIDDAEAAWKWSSKVRARTYDAAANAVNGTATGGTTTTVVMTGAGWGVNAYQGAYVLMTGGTAGNIGEIREVLSNTATTLTLVTALPASVANADTFTIGGLFTSGIADRSRETIEAPGTILSIDSSSGAIGTTDIDGEFISFSVTYMNNTNPKRFMENIDSYAPRLGQGEKIVTGQVRLEFARRDEYDHWQNLDPRAIRIFREGSVIDSGAGSHKHAQIDIYRAYWDTLDESEREENITATFGFVGFVDLTEGIPFELTAKTAFANCP